MRVDRAELHSRDTVRAIALSMRPRQWLKNVLVLVAPAAAGLLSHAGVLEHCAVAFVAFCLCASGVYLFNDVRDREADRAHPRKKNRAIASGALAPQRAVVAGVVLCALGLGVTQADHPDLALFGVLALYVANAVAYVLIIKSRAVIEMGSVAAGFFLRAIAGGVAAHIFISTWFFVVVSFGALFLVVGKRLAERHELGDTAVVHRAVLAEYSDSYLSSALTMVSAVLAAGYCLWAFDTTVDGLSTHDHNIVAIRLTVVPVVLVILYVLRVLESGGGGAPEDLAYEDRTVQVLAVVWIVLILIGVYG
jgi:decaprenyl-phosphate phosphoribosyltransferase